MSDRLKIMVQHMLPKQWLTQLAGRFARGQHGAMTTALICWFVRRYGVDMREADNADIGNYASFNDFFTRPLKPGVRPLADADFVCPVDGAISQFGAIDNHHIVQAKNHRFTTMALVGGDAALAAPFRHGSFANLYLSPRDFHRLLRTIHVPGALFSVNPVTARGVPGLFARNERVVCLFESPGHGPFVMVLVGATIVGSMATVWHGLVNPPRGKVVREWLYPVSPDKPEASIFLKQGEEMGRFLLGSTVVMLFPNGNLRFNPDWAPGRVVRLGEAMADYVTP